jgi:hypothetical protein
MLKSGPVYFTASAATINTASNNTTATATTTTTNNNDNNNIDEDFPLSIITIFFFLSSYDFLSLSSLHHGILNDCHLPTQVT